MIYPGMKQAIINVLQVSQERINDRKVSEYNKSKDTSSLLELL